MVPRDPAQLTEWERRSARAALLADRYAASRQILLFYAALADWQDQVARGGRPLQRLRRLFPSLLELVARTGPEPLARAARELGPEQGRNLVDQYWQRHIPPSPLDFFARIAAQPYAASLPAGQECPWCRLPPQVGALRTQGEGLALDLICTLCLRPRPFLRARCPACNESSEEKLPTFAAPEFAHLRLQVCESCRTYLPLVDLSRDPQAIPEVDELVGLPLDLWAQEQGYLKLQPNVAGI